MLHKLAEANSTFVRNLMDLAKEVGEYHQSQKDRIKSNVSVSHTYIIYCVHGVTPCYTILYVCMCVYILYVHLQYYMRTCVLYDR